MAGFHGSTSGLIPQETGNTVTTGLAQSFWSKGECDDRTSPLTPAPNIPNSFLETLALIKMMRGVHKATPTPTPQERFNLPWELCLPPHSEGWPR